MTPTKPLPIIVDSREQWPWLFEAYPGVVVIRGALRSGDYSIQGFEDRVALERKTLPDLVSSLSAGRGRFEREMERLSALEFAAVLVEGSAEDIVNHKYRSAMSPASVLQTIYAWTIRHGVNFMFCGTRRHAEYTAHGLLTKWARERENLPKPAPRTALAGAEVTEIVQ